jgi:hypothetical protein
VVAGFFLFAVRGSGFRAGVGDSSERAGCAAEEVGDVAEVLAVGTHELFVAKAGRDIDGFSKSLPPLRPVKARTRQCCRAPARRPGYSAAQPRYFPGRSLQARKPTEPVRRPISYSQLSEVMDPPPAPSCGSSSDFTKSSANSWPDPIASSTTSSAATNSWTGLRHKERCQQGQCRLTG